MDLKSLPWRSVVSRSRGQTEKFRQLAQSSSRIATSEPPVDVNAERLIQWTRVRVSVGFCKSTPVPKENYTNVGPNGSFYFNGFTNPYDLFVEGSLCLLSGAFKDFISDTASYVEESIPRPLPFVVGSIIVQVRSRSEFCAAFELPCASAT
jgi:hypothetical protein